MPIIDVRAVVSSRQPLPAGAAQSLAHAVAAALAAPPGRVWVRVSEIEADHYAESGGDVEASGLPVFVTILHADLPDEPSRDIEVQALTRTVASCLHRAVDRVHLEYAPPGRGRLAFGGVLIR